MSVYLDDILLTWNLPEKCLSILEAVLTRLKDAGLHLNQKNCAFMLEALSTSGTKSQQTA